MSRQRLSPEEIDRRLAELQGWSLAAGKLHRELSFDDFVAAFGFMASVALIAEAMCHHPEWSNVYNRVTLDLSTHDAGGLTALDFEFAARVDRLLGRVHP
ncbi:MAG: 4a-hydroxytetrahydrobiopterin dehydratase [Thermoanaerobaculia bacterium]|nr:4a-hydroxytetrahydrobiopterin dehydratase [Thermoanaerobaculia bacterium]